jgi:DNA topoisomerase IB
VHVRGERTFFSYTAKGGIERETEITDRPTATVVRQLLERPADTGADLLAYQTDDGEWRDVTSDEINAYLKEISDAEITAKDFRTWNGTVLAAAALREVCGKGPRGRSKRVVAKCIERVAERLGNTKTVCRKCYVHPAVIDAYLDGTLATALGNGDDLEAGVLKYLRTLY